MKLSFGHFFRKPKRKQAEHHADQVSSTENGLNELKQDKKKEAEASL